MECSADLKLKNLRHTTKYIFREAMKGILPGEVLRQPKAGFGAPADYWLANDLKEMVDDLLSETRVRQRGLFRPELFASLWRNSGEELRIGPCRFGSFLLSNYGCRHFLTAR